MNYGTSLQFLKKPLGSPTKSRPPDAAELAAVSNAVSDHPLPGEIKESNDTLFTDARVTRLCLDRPNKL